MSVQEIKTLINNSVEKVGVGTKQAHLAGTTMSQVVDSVQRVSDIINEITIASNEQSSGIEQVNQAIIQIDDVTQQNAALVEEAAAASQSLQEQAAKLSQLVNVFKIEEKQNETSVATVRAIKTTKKLTVPVKSNTTMPVKLAATDWEEF